MFAAAFEHAQMGGTQGLGCANHLIGFLPGGGAGADAFQLADQQYNAVILVRHLVPEGERNRLPLNPLHCPRAVARTFQYKSFGEKTK